MRSTRPLSIFLILLYLCPGQCVALPDILSWFTGGETELQESKTMDGFPCPESELIAPCICIHQEVDGTGFLYLDCTLVSSEDELASVFDLDFPVKEFYEFKIAESTALKTLDFDCQGVTFERLNFCCGDFYSLERISDAFFYSCFDKLDYLRIYTSKLKHLPPAPTNGSLEYFEIADSSMTVIPPLDPTNLKSFEFSYSELLQISTDTFEGATAITNFRVYHNNLTSLPVRSVPLASAGRYYLNYNDIAFIEPGAFYLTNNAANDSIRIEISFNSLPIIDENVFGHLMQFIDYIYIQGNYLDCGCDIAWIVLNPEYMQKVDHYLPTCKDGTLIRDLDPEYFDVYC